VIVTVVVAPVRPNTADAGRRPNVQMGVAVSTDRRNTLS